jgi:hypothetical protein
LIGVRAAEPTGSLGRWVVWLGTASLLIWVGLAAAGDLTQRIPLFLLLYALLFAAYSVLLAVSRWGERLARGRGLEAALLFAVLFRVAAVTAPPSLSTDLYRYVWDGRVFISGVNPFRHAPDAPELVPLRDDLHTSINHPELPTIYPPAAQLVFASAARVWPRPAGFKLVMGLLDLLALAAVAGLLKAMRQPPGRLLIHAWCPLSILELSGMGHVDAVGIALLVAALLALERRRQGVALMALGASILGKLLPFLLVPTFLLRTRRRLWILLPLVLIAGFLPFYAGGVDPTVSLRTFALHWRGNDLLFSGFVWLTGSPLAAKASAALLIAVVVLFCLVRRVSPAATALVSVSAVLLVSPVLHPWYLTWLPPLLALRPSVPGVAWTGSVVLAYLAWSRFHTLGVYEVVPWVRALELLLPLAAALVIGVFCRPGRGQEDPSAD